MLRLILCGNPNSGKSTLFNRLCGAYRHTGNFPGVSVDRGEGVFVRDGICYTVVDLPGMYALTAGSAEEQIAAEALLGIDGVLVQVIDTAAPERALRLTATLAALRRPLVLAMNMADEAERRGVTVDLPAFTQMTGIPAVSISARRGEGLEDLLAAARHAPLTAGGFDAEAVAAATVTRRHTVSLDDRLDGVLLRPYVGLPLAAFLTGAMLYLAFGRVGTALQGALNALLDAAVRVPLSHFCAYFAVSPILTSFLSDGICVGVLGVLGFLPQIALLFACLSVFEDSGLTARMAFLCDPLFSRFGLSGKAFFPLCIGFGCTVPAVMATRVASARERRILYFCLPFICCPARAPVLALLAAAFFPRAGFLPLLLLYVLGLAAALLASAVLDRFCGGEQTAFVIELPPYRLPHLCTLFAGVRNKCRDFLVRAGTVIFFSSAAVWLMENLGPHGLATTAEDSFLYRIGSFLAPPLAPLGFGNATAASALLLGFFAKETILSTFGVLTGGLPLTDTLRTLFTPASAAAFSVFSLLYTPCFATCAVLCRECGVRRAATAVAFDFAFAYAAAWLTKTAAGLFC